ncbi:MAG: hypothetical protein BWY79_01675 [Actinobacteria bacterium ADurb.Bin444]|nr:MAG: hypothetical protein BWY79_01675 [Actinobacteria bacterium ADurb.Bin444]
MFEQPLPHEQRVLEDFAEPIPHLRVRQSDQVGGVDEYALRLIEGADQILAVIQVHGHFSANTRVNLCHHRRWYLPQWQPSQVGGGNKPTQVTDDATAHNYKHVIAVDTLFGQCIPACARRIEGLACFACR